MKFIENDDLKLDSLDTRLSAIIEQHHEAEIAKKLKEAFPDLDNDLAEKYSRCDELNPDLPDDLIRLHRRLRKDTCRGCGGYLTGGSLRYGGVLNDEVGICEHCRNLLIIRGWLEELYSSLSLDIEGAIIDALH